jgi:WD40 repeat protein
MENKKIHLMPITEEASCYNPEPLKALVIKFIKEHMTQRLFEEKTESVVQEIEELDQHNIHTFKDAIKADLLDKYSFRLIKPYGYLFHKWNYTPPIRSMVSSRDGRYALLDCHSAIARVLYLASFHDKLEQYELKGHTKQILSIALSLGGKRALTGSKDKTARVWDLTDLDNPQSYELEGYDDSVGAVGLSADGECALTSSNNSIMKIWDLSDLNNVQSYDIEGAIEQFTHIAWSSADKYALTGSRRELRMWNLTSLSKPCSYVITNRFDLEGLVISSLALSQNGKRAIVGFEAGQVQVWDVTDVTNPQLLHMFFPNVDSFASPVNAVQFSPDGNYILAHTSGQIAVVYDLQNKTVPAPEELSINRFNLTGLSGMHIKVTNSSSIRFERSLLGDGSITSAALSSDCKCILTHERANKAIRFIDLTASHLTLETIVDTIKSEKVKEN